MVYAVNASRSPGENTKSSILSAAIELCLAGGLANVTMRAIASKVGVSATAIYRHYEKRDDVVEALVAHANMVLQSFILPPSGTKDGLPQVVAISRGYLTFYLTEPRLYSVLFDTGDRNDLESLPEKVESPNFALFVSSISRSMDAGQLLPGDPVEVAVTLWAYFHGIVLLHRAGRFGPSSKEFEALFERGVRSMLVGLASRDGVSQWQSAWGKRERGGTHTFRKD